MSDNLENSLLHKVKTPKDLRVLNDNQLDQVSRELRNEVIEVVAKSMKWETDFTFVLYFQKKKEPVSPFFYFSIHYFTTNFVDFWTPSTSMTNR